MVKKKNSTKIERYVRFCPRCRSTDIGTAASDAFQGDTGIPRENMCNNCGLVASSFPEVSTDEAKHLTPVPKSELKGIVDNESSFARFLLGKWWLIIGISCLVLGLMLIILSFFPMNCHYEYQRLTGGMYEFMNVTGNVRICEKDHSVLFNQENMLYGATYFAAGTIYLIISLLYRRKHTKRYDKS